MKSKKKSDSQTNYVSNPNELLLLNLISKHPEGITFTQIINQTKKSKSTISDTLKRLESKKRIHARKAGKQKFFHLIDSSSIQGSPTNRRTMQEMPVFRGHKYVFEVILKRTIRNLPT